MNLNHCIRAIAQPAKGFTTLLIILLAIGVVQIVAIESSWVLFARPSHFTPTPDRIELTEEQARLQRIQHARKEFLPDGTLHLVTGLGGPRRIEYFGLRRSPAQERVFDVNDQLLWEGPTKERPYAYLSWAVDALRDSFRADYMRIDLMESPSRHLQIPVAAEERLLEMWRYCPWTERFVGYDLKGRRVGYLGAAGPANSRGGAESLGPFRALLAWWPVDSHSPTFLWRTDRRIYQIRFDKPQVDLLFESPKSDIDRLYVRRWDAYQARIVQDEPNELGNDRSLLHCQSEDRKHHLILKDPAHTITVSIPDNWKRWFGNQLEFGATKQAVFMRRHWVEYPRPVWQPGPDWWTRYNETTKTQWVELYRVSDTGQLSLVNRHSWVIPGREKRPAPTRPVNPRTYVQPNVNAFSPLLNDLVWSAGVRRYKSEHREFGELIEETRPGYRLRHWVVTAILLVLTFLHGRSRRPSKGTLIFWLVFVALLNLAGFLTYWALNHTPVIKCSACGKRRGLGQVNCVRCQAPLPTPEHGKLDLILGL